MAVRCHESGPSDGGIQQLIRRDRLLNDALRVAAAKS